ncbi:type II toxin-antitoxin system prevent-host-death family antitoxin [Mycolicibacter sp. MYC123]|uniref:Type II toxin-antitoxin system prevent-host-death family antitoxin n=1 Tax=[Mycobacterium] zoologicum TaxID=2872311 RepID=A0ABU5YKB4_9MYCO|nr:MULTISPECIES: type II toxin-antitoxin system prevent-host-death family antitoxin [unclassified Mycolicibacter]MEB3050493.1 type II toxin-antitoxin system prevent-host-death family antitoxin [Mycolicibacter sp. MYC123]MEB3064071.1 type II toxin-antitoxin system prevent-host-death family antitoxin [Mycolicibacter sp. MYC101]
MTTADAPRIPQRELRNESSRVLREVRAGQSYVVTVDGQPVADLVPHARTPRRTAVPRDEVVRAFSALSPGGQPGDYRDDRIDDTIYDPYDRAYREGQFAPRATE